MERGRALGLVAWVAGVAACGGATVVDDRGAAGEVAGLAALRVSSPEARLLAVEATRTTFEIRVLVTNENDADVVIRHVRGTLLLDGQAAAAMQIEGPQGLEAQAERVFVFEVHVPLSVLATVRGDSFTVRGELVADGGGGDGALRTPIDFTAPIPR